MSMGSPSAVAPLAVTRIGCLIPQGNVVCETEFPQRMPPGYGIHFQRLERAGTEVTSDSLLGMKPIAVEAARIFMPIKPSVVAFACTSGTFLSGPQKHDEVAQAIRERTGTAAFTTSTALLQALGTLGLQRVLMVTPYPQAVNAAEIGFLAAHGTQVLDCLSFECAEFEAIRAVSEQQVADTVREAAPRYAGRIDGVFISCTNLSTLNAIEPLEQATGLPVISSNAVTLWAALRHAGCLQPLPGLGTLGKAPLAALP